MSKVLTIKPTIYYTKFNKKDSQTQKVNDIEYFLMKDVLSAFGITDNFREYQKDKTYKIGTVGFQTPQLKFHADDNKLRKQPSISSNDVVMI